MAGQRTIDKAWHQMRQFRPPLEQWEAFAAACRYHGRDTYSKVWARHQWLCWSELSDAGTYPQQRANWAERQAKFERDMAARHPGRVRTNAQIRQSQQQSAPEPDHQQLGLAL